MNIITEIYYYNYYYSLERHVERTMTLWLRHCISRVLLSTLG